ncbi:MAG: acyltransferase family protein [Clostridia bacterium]|nr:acyltransferase family protein [Clostridia bacterium]
MSDNNVSAKKERQIGLDIIRTLAIIFVFITHGITYKGYLDQNVLTNEWTLVLVIRFIALCCVPLFLLLTGYLNNKKEISLKYYKAIIPLLLSYFLISFIELFGFNLFTTAPISNVTSISGDTIISGESISQIGNTAILYTPERVSQIRWPEHLVKIFNFTENSYAWYFEMYIGLFLLIPFLNILWDNLKSKKERVILIITCSFLSLIPKILEGFRIYNLNGDGNMDWLDVLPDYWKIVHPLAYFYIGKYIKEYKPNINLIIRLVLFIIAVAIPVLSCYFVSKNANGYAWYMFNGFGTITNAFVAVTVFLLFYNINKKIPLIAQVISQIAICSFEMYLFSSIFDKIYYTIFAEKSLIFVVFMTLISTYICARIWIWIRDLIFKKLLKIY